MLRTENIFVRKILRCRTSQMCKFLIRRFSYIKDELYELGKIKVKTPYGNEVNIDFKGTY